MLVVDGGGDLDALVIQHMQSLVGVEGERATRDRERRDRVGETLLCQLLDGEIGADAAHPRLEQAGLTAAGWCLLSFHRSATTAARILANDFGVPTISSEFDEITMLMCASSEARAIATSVSNYTDAVGISASIVDVSRLRDGAREARWALESARTQGVQMAEYDTGAPLFLPRTVDEARLAANVVLSALIDHDESQGTELVRTLRVFFAEERRWDAAAERLHIHRQTLGYRIRKVESLTGRSTRRPADIALLWMALLELDIAGGA
jgi:purine catabolism regulator